MLILGIVLTAATVTILAGEFFRARRHSFPVHGWLALAAIAGAQFLMFHGVEPAASYFNPVAWTAYILLADAAIVAISGQSRLRDESSGFVKMAALSALLWLIFEAYNLRLATWAYVGLPREPIVRILSYAWCFATITPALFMTAALIESFGWFERRSRPLVLSRTTENALLATGVSLAVIVPLLARHAGTYFSSACLIALVWIGFILALDTINHRLDLPSFQGDLARGYRGRLYSFLLAGWVYGWLSEFWNYWAAAKWIYPFPVFDRWKIFEMPAPGYIAYPILALECFAMYVTGAWVFSRKYAVERNVEE